MHRRSFLSAILVGATAPAIVRASSLMPLWVPKQEIVTTGYLQLADNYADNLAKSMAATKDYYIERINFGLAPFKQEGQFILRDTAPDMEPGERLIWPFQPDEAVVPPGWELHEHNTVLVMPR